jgi:hypothetical protein
MTSFNFNSSVNFNLSAQFQRFAGKEVEVIETTHQTKYGPMISTHLVEPNPIIEELKQAVTDAGLKLRLWLPDRMGIMDYRTDRLNVHVGKEADGKYRISPAFTIG